MKVNSAHLRYAGSPFAATFGGNRSPAGDAPTVPSPGSERKARIQMGRVLLLLGALDTSVLVSVVALAELWTYARLSSLEFLIFLLLGVAIVLGVRIGMAVRLRNRAGDL